MCAPNVKSAFAGQSKIKCLVLISFKHTFMVYNIYSALCSEINFINIFHQVNRKFHCLFVRRNEPLLNSVTFSARDGIFRDFWRLKK